MSVRHRHSLHASLAVVATVTAVLLPCAALADDAREATRAKLLEQMRSLAQETKVEFAEGNSRVVFVDKPVFRYDDQPRRFIDATMWTWTHQGRPVAFQKVEAMEHQKTSAPLWGYCFTSLAEANLIAQWAGGRKYQSTEPGAAYLPVPAVSDVAKQSVQRRRQLRDLARDFSARIVNNPRTNDSEAMRLLTTPIFEYHDEATKLLQGAVFGYSTNGTNPDLLIAFEAREADGKVVWHYAPARMTTGGLTVKYHDKVVWECPFVQPGGGKFPTWTFFVADRKPVEFEP